jgi:hypothetical protein
MEKRRGTSASGEETSTPKDISKSELEKKTRIRGWSTTQVVVTGRELSDACRQTIKDAPELEDKSTSWT